MSAPPADEVRLAGVPAADGIVVGPAMLLPDLDLLAGGSGGPAAQAEVRTALGAVAARLGQAAARLRAAGRDADAELLEAGQLMAEDPTLLAEAEALAATMPAAAALLLAGERQADLLAAIPDEYLAARAADVRRLGRQAARLAVGATVAPAAAPTGSAVPAPAAREPATGAADDAGGRPVILVARDLGPADFAEIELAGLLLGGIALAEGAATSHAAIVARGLGVPLVIGLGDAVLAVPNGATVVLDGAAGAVVAAPTAESLRAARAAVDARHERQARLVAGRAAPAVTRDGHAVRLLANASTAPDVAAALAAGAEGVGLLRTELSFLEATAWPGAEAHAAAVRPALHRLDGRLATVRTLDFGADKTPPFLRGRPGRGIALQLASPGALAAQLRGLLTAAAETGARIRIMLPLAEDLAQLRAARAALATAWAATAGSGLSEPPALGAMIETPTAVANADALAAEADFLSIGTNDLVQELLGLDRLGPAATVRAAADPRVLGAVRAVVEAARRFGRTVEVCGEAAGEPGIAALLVGLGVTELSVAPPRLDEVRAVVRGSLLARLAALAETALGLPSADAVLALLDQAPLSGAGTPDDAGS